MAVFLTVSSLLFPALRPFTVGEASSAEGASVRSSLLEDDSYDLPGGWDWESLADEAGYVEVILSYSNIASSPEAVASLEAEYGIEKEDTFSLAFSGISGRMQLDSLRSMISLESGNVTAYPDLTLVATLTESVVQIGADQIHQMRDAQGRSVTGEGVVVAVIDTGVDYTHPDLGGGIGPGFKVIGGYDFYNDDSDPKDDNGHGTHVAGIIAANGNTTGVAPDASILAYKTLGADGSGSMSKTILAIERAMDPNSDGITTDRADVISMSLGGPGTVDDPICISVESAVQNGIVVVVAAGNSGPSMGTVASPGIAPSAITVGAVDDDGVLASFSSRGMIPDTSIKPEISAPGVSIVSTVPFSDASKSNPSGYATMSGTSMATPHVSGGAALLLQLHDDWTPEQVKSAIVSGSVQLNESLWAAGAGGLWLPGAASQHVFFSPAVVSYGFAGDSAESIEVSNLGSPITLTTYSEDFFSMSADGTRGVPEWTNFSTSSPSSITLQSFGSASTTLSVQRPSVGCSEGYYDGSILLGSGSVSARVPFGFAILSRLNVHVYDELGREVLDPYGGVWVYSHPDAEVGMGVRGGIMPSPPASFLVPAGEYAVHSAGHYLIYSYSNPYILYDRVTLGFLQTVDVYLNMTEARQMVIDLETADGNPIYVKDFRVYARHVGATNVSFHLTGTDYDIEGPQLFSIPKSKTVYVSDTDATVGIQVTGYSYSAKMWDFMNRNWRSWYEFDEGTSTDFFIDASADLQYLMAWEFPGVDASTPTSLTLVEGLYSVYDIKYDIPGKLTTIWGDWQTHRAVGGDAVFYTRRDTETSVNPFYSGMTRRTYVQGVFSDLYHPLQLSQGFFEQEYYVPDYDYLVHARTISEIYLPDRNFITPIQGVYESIRVGSGPFYPSVTTSNDNDTFGVIQPLLRDQGDSKVGGMYYPDINLYRNGMFVGLYQMADYLARPDGIRFVNLTQAGTYNAKIEYKPVPQICSAVTVSLGFTVPALDVDPPYMTGLSMAQRFVPGASIDLSFSASDAVSVVSATTAWRENGASSWTPVAVATSDNHDFSSTFQTPNGAAALDIKILLTDSSGNTLEYIAENATLAQIPVRFSLSADASEIRFRNGDEYVTLTGYLEDMSGNPLHEIGGVPLELMVNGEKVGMILDEYVTTGSHEHNGDIRFEWHFNPYNLFTGSDQTVEVQVTFDLGIYEPITSAFTLRSVQYVNSAPVISLVSPANNSLIDAGTTIDLSIWDDRSATAVAYLDGVSLGDLPSPWDLSTQTWSDGPHVLRVVAADGDGGQDDESFSFDVDSLPPAVGITSPSDGSNIPRDWTMVVSVSDDHLSTVTYSLDGGPAIPTASPYTVAMTGWSVGSHSVQVVATDMVGHSSSAVSNFTILDGNIAINLVSTSDNGLVKRGTAIVFSVVGEGSISSRWIEAGVSHDLGTATSIPTDDWTDGSHSIVINATNDLGGFDDLQVTIWIDGTYPVIVLVSPANGDFVSENSVINFQVVDDNFESVSCVVWGVTRGSTYPSLSFPLVDFYFEGYFNAVVTAVDKVGHSVEQTFVFAMDLSDPVIEFEGVVNGTAVRAGTTINVTVTDTFLSLVQWSLNGGDLQLGGPAFQVSTGAMSTGWKYLEITAWDYSGRSSYVNLTFYVDASNPIITVSPIDARNPDGSLTIAASASDDFGVKNAELWYETDQGSYVMVPMVFDGTFWVGTIPSTDLWEGMNVHVDVYDTVGNCAQSPDIEIEEMPEIVPPSDDDDGQSDDKQGSPFMIVTDPILLGGISLAAIAVFSLMVAHKKKSREEDEVPYRALTAPLPFKVAQPAAVPSAPRVAPSRPSVVAAAANARPRTVSVASASTKTPTPVSPPKPAPQPRPIVVDYVDDVVERSVPKAAPVVREEPLQKPEAELYIPQSDLDELVSLAQMAVNRRMGIKTDATTILHGLELQEALEKKPRPPSASR